MINLSINQNLRNELLLAKREKLQVEQELSNIRKLQLGAFDIRFYRMEKQKRTLQERITQINSVLRPDIIA